MSRRDRLSTALRHGSVAAGAAVVLAGVVFLVGGWWLDVAVIRQPLPDYSAIRSGTAVGLILSGVGVVAAGLRWSRWATGTIGLLVGALGLTVLAVYALDRPKLGLEAVFAGAPSLDELVPGRIAINTAACFVTLGAGLVLLALERAPGLRQGLGVGVFLVAYTAVMGFVMASVEVSGQFLPTYTAMSPATAVPTMLLGAGLLCVSVDRGWGSLLADPNAGGRVVRTYLPLTLLLFLVAASGFALLQRAGGEDAQGGVVILVIVAILVVVGLILLGTRLERIDSERAGLVPVAEQEELLRVVLDHTRDAIMRFGPDLRVDYVNRSLVDFTGISFDDWRGKTFREAGFPPELTATWDEYSRRVFATGQPVFHSFELDLPGGHRWFETRVDPEFSADGSVAHVITASRDVTDQVLYEQSLSQSRELLRVVLDGSGDATMRLSRDLRIEYVNREVEEVTGIPSEEWIGRTVAEMGFPEELATRLDAVRRRVLDSGETASIEYEVDNVEGHRWYEASVAPVFDELGSVTHLIETSRDITGRKGDEAELVRLANHDPLTGLANRSALLEETNRALRAGHRSGRHTAVLMVDLDRFKFVNDSLGHGAGDELLLAAARRLESGVRGGDLVARPGGDEFIVVMRDLEDPSEALAAAWRLVEAFRRPFVTSGAELYATTSIGVAIATELSAAEDLVREADTAMYVAKESGRDRVSVFNEDLRALATERLSIEGDLRRALPGGQLAVWYQPEVDLATGQVIAVEALLRWHHPDGTVWSADRFIEVAEDTGLVLDIGDWVLRQACGQAAAWAAARPDRPVTVRVNASALQIAEAGLLDAIDAALASCGLDPALLCIEITETALLRETTAATDNMRGIHERRIGIAIDDFGTGYASLTYLRQYPIDVIKIDRSFVTDATVRENGHQLVEGIVAFARALGIAVTAEGVEHPEQAARLREIGCPSAQGWLFSKAVPPDQIDALLDRPYPCF
jgi:diguanylate cyclase (GGDEF)-like protein/PAS domain S-box-containing protein